MRVVNMRTAIERDARTPLVVVIASAHRARKGLVIVDEYLIDRGVSEAGRKRWSSAFGRAAAKAARIAGTSIASTWILWRGRVRRVFAHAGPACMDAAWAGYAGRINKG
jgi:hypothetical protein